MITAQLCFVISLSRYTELSCGLEHHFIRQVTDTFDMTQSSLLVLFKRPNEINELQKVPTWPIIYIKIRIQSRLHSKSKEPLMYFNCTSVFTAYEIIKGMTEFLRPPIAL